MFESIRSFKTLLTVVLFVTGIAILILWGMLKNEPVAYKEPVYKFNVTGKIQCSSFPWVWVGDLEEDGEDEFILFFRRPIDKLQYNFLIYRNYRNQAWRAYSFQENVVDYFNCFDIDGDGVKEILVPFVEHHFLKVRILSILDTRERIVSLLPVGNSASTRFRVGIAGIIRKGDEPILIYQIMTAYTSGIKRGLYASSLSDGRLLWRKIFASYLNDVVIDDLDGNGVPEIICSAYTTNRRYPVQADYDNSTAGVLIFNPEGHEVWRDLHQGNFIEVRLLSGDLDPTFPGKEIAYAVTKKNLLEPEGNQIFLFNFKRGVFRNKFLLDRIWDLVAFDYLDDAVANLVIMVDAYQLKVLDSRLQIKAEINDPRLRGKRRMKVGEDSKQQPILMVSGERGSVVMNSELKCLFEYSDNIINTYHPGYLKKPELMIYSAGKKTIEFVQFHKSYYGAYRILFMLLIGLFLGLVLARIFIQNINIANPDVLDRVIRAGLKKNPDFGMGIFDSRGRLLAVNPRMETIFNYKFQRKVGYHYTEIFAVFQRTLKNYLDIIFVGGVSDHKSEISHRVGDQEREIMVTFNKIAPDSELNSEEFYVFWIAHDITELSKSRRLAAWLSMAQRYAHEIKTPLSTVNLTAQRIEMELRNNGVPNLDRYSAYLSSMREEVHRIRRVTNGFLKFARAEKLEKSPVEINAFLNRLGEIYLSRLPDGIELSVTGKDEDIFVLLDEEQFQIAMENVIDNAINAIGEQGSIVIQADVIEEVDDVTLEMNSKLLIEISDSGCGIPEDKLDKVFQPYFSSSDEGTGLGLVFTKIIVEEHGGSISIRSKPNIGTVVTIKMPVRNFKQRKPNDA